MPTTRKTTAQIRAEIASYLSARGSTVPRRSPPSRRRSRPGISVRPRPQEGGGRCPYHEIGSAGDRWPAWLSALKESSGAYIIRDAVTKKPLYAGSAKNNLYATITRHFQQWNRQKRWWKGQYGAGHDPGLVYERGRCEVAAWKTTEDERLHKESELIARFRPRDNLVEHPDGEVEEAPF